MDIRAPQVSALTDAVRALLRFEHPADAVMRAWFREHPDLGARDRALIADTAFGILRHLRRLQHLAPDQAPRKLVLAWMLRRIEQMMDYLLGHRPHMINLIAFNPHEGTLWAKEVNVRFQASYVAMAEAAKYCIGRAEQAGIWVNVRYMPLCHMQGYEAHVCNFKQWQFDPYEWEFFSSNLRDDGPALLEAAKREGAFGATEEEQLYHHLMDISTRTNVRALACRDCCYARLCDGIYPQYARAIGFDEFVGVPGPVLEDPLHFRVRDQRWRVPSRPDKALSA